MWHQILVRCVFSGAGVPPPVVTTPRATTPNPAPGPGPSPSPGPSPGPGPIRPVVPTPGGGNPLQSVAPPTVPVTLRPNSCAIPQIANAVAVDCDTSQSDGRVPINNVCFVTCQDGFQIDGPVYGVTSDTIVCGSNGQLETTRCVGKSCTKVTVFLIVHSHNLVT